MHLSPVTPADLHLINPMTPPDWPEIGQYFQFYINAPFSHPIKVTEGEEILGVGNRLVFGETAWLVLIVVNTEHRKRGIGSYITKALVDACLADGCKTVMLISSALGESVYRKLGFEPEGAMQFYKGGNIPLPDTDYVVPFRPEWEEELLALDTRSSGEERSQLLRPHLPNALVYLSNGKPGGVYLPTLGEGYILAETAAAGTALMAHKYARPHEHAPMPDANEAGIAFLQKHGYTLTGQLTRMRFGEPVPWRAENLFSRIGGLG